jgi:hypothetical protein
MLPKLTPIQTAQILALVNIAVTANDSVASPMQKVDRK